MEDALEQTFKDEVNKIVVWIQQWDKQLDDAEFVMTVKDVHAYIHVCCLFSLHAVCCSVSSGRSEIWFSFANISCLT